MQNPCKVADLVYSQYQRYRLELQHITYDTDQVSHAGRLSRIQQQVLEDVSKRLPPEMQILDIVLRLLSRNERMSILRQAASGQGGDNVPPCNIKRVRGAALQLVSDMEEKDAIPDRCTQMSC